MQPVELLRQYLRTAEPAELKADWDAIEALGLEGPTLTETLAMSTIIKMPTSNDSALVPLDPVETELVLARHKSLQSALGVLMGEYQKGALTKGYLSTLLAVSEAYCSELLDAFGYQGQLAEEIEERYTKIRALKIENQDLRAQLGNKVTSEDLRERIKAICTQLYDWWSEIGFNYLDDASVDWAFISVKLGLSFQKPLFLLPENKVRCHHAFNQLTKRGFTFNDTAFSRCQLIANQGNQALLRALIIDRFPSAILGKIQTAYDVETDCFVLTEIEFKIHEFSDLDLKVLTLDSRTSDK